MRRIRKIEASHAEEIARVETDLADGPVQHPYFADDLERLILRLLHHMCIVVFAGLGI